MEMKIIMKMMTSTKTDEHENKQHKTKNGSNDCVVPCNNEATFSPYALQNVVWAVGGRENAFISFWKGNKKQTRAMQ